ncbi:hypothetical protein D3C86_1744670 [compost metagenome]
MTGPGDALVHRAHGDDLAGGPGHAFANTLPVENTQGGTGAEELPGEVDTDHLVPVGEGHVDGGGVFLHTGIGHQNVQITEGVKGLRKQSFDVVLFGNVGTDGDGAATFIIDLPGQCFGGFSLGMVVDHHCGTGSGQGLGSRGADAGTGAGDQSDLSVEGKLHKCQHLELRA